MLGQIIDHSLISEWSIDTIHGKNSVSYFYSACVLPLQISSLLNFLEHSNSSIEEISLKRVPLKMMCGIENSI